MTYCRIDLFSPKYPESISLYFKLSYLYTTDKTQEMVDHLSKTGCSVTLVTFKNEKKYRVSIALSQIKKGSLIGYNYYFVGENIPTSKYEDSPQYLASVINECV